MKSLFLVLSAILIFCATGHAQNDAAYLKRNFEMNDNVMPYRLLLPENYNPQQEYPLILVLHGSGERGNDNELQLVHGSSLFLQKNIREKYRAIVVFPQCAANSSWAKIDVTGEIGNRSFVFYKKPKPTKDMLLLEGLLKKLGKEFKLAKDQMYVGGLSMGGIGTFELVRRNPRLFAAAFPICGGAHPTIAKKINKVNWWVFHGEEDDVVPSKYSTLMVNALRTHGADVQYSLYPNVKHNSWDNAFSEPELLPWLFSIKK